MKTAWIARGCIIISFGIIAGVFGFSGTELVLYGTVPSLLVGALWLANRYLKWTALPSFGLLASTALAVLGLLFGLPRTPIAIALVLGIAGWNLDLFSQSLGRFERVEGDIKARHLKVLGLISLAALLLLLIGLNLRFNLTFGLLLLMAVISFVSLIIILRLGRSAV